MIHRKCFTACFLGLLSVFPIAAESEPESGQVELPIATYNQLVERGRAPRILPRVAPAPFALGPARVALQVEAGARSALVEAAVPLRVLDDDWVLVPILPAGTAVESASVDGRNLSLIQAPGGLAWGVRGAANYQLSLVYRVDIERTGAGFSLALPLPASPSSQFEAVLPGTALDLALIPASGTRTQNEGANTRVFATLPSGQGVHLSWRPPVVASHAVSRARYRGELKGRAVEWQGELDVDVFDDASLSLPILPQSTTLNRLEVDGDSVPILIADGTIRAIVQGRGQHTVRVGFETSITRGQGPPEVVVDVPRVPISRFDLTLPGEKEVEVLPSSNVIVRRVQGQTVATAHVPLASRVTLRWTEAIPDEVESEARANANLYHVVHASEGVLYVRALVDYEIVRGRSHILRFDLPIEAQINRVESEDATIADWRLGENVDGRRELTVFLDRQLTGGLQFKVFYDQSLQNLEEELQIPLLSSLDAQRQRGMVALLSSRDLALEPLSEEGATRVGENLLPSFLAETLERPVSHTFKYVENRPRLSVEATTPERQQGRFDAQITTLISLGEVSLTGSSGLEVNVKSGGIMDLAFELPKAVNLLRLTGPSVREHRVEETEGRHRITVEFTQEMIGQFRLEVGYEHLLTEGETTIEVPSLDIVGAEVQQGRIAVEALSAVEMQAETSEQLTALDLNELPQQLVLRTSHPILMAYKYVATPYRLDLSVTRHEVVAVQEAAIDQARYRTLFTRDGLAVTTAQFEIRNSGKQFLRLQLPEEATIWSAFVDGRAEKPARSIDDRGQVWHLIKILRSTEGFVVELIFESPARAIRGLGTLSGVLPRPEILVTHSRWDVFLPAGVTYFEPTGDMGRVVDSDSPAVDGDAHLAFAELARQAPLRLSVPAPEESIHFAFEKLYANQAEKVVGIEIPFASVRLTSVFWLLLWPIGFWLAWLGWKRYQSSSLR